MANSQIGKGDDTVPPVKIESLANVVVGSQRHQAKPQLTEIGDATQARGFAAVVNDQVQGCLHGYPLFFAAEREIAVPMVLREQLIIPTKAMALQEPAGNKCPHSRLPVAVEKAVCRCSGIGIETILPPDTIKKATY